MKKLDKVVSMEMTFVQALEIVNASNVSAEQLASAYVSITERVNKLSVIASGIRDKLGNVATFNELLGSDSADKVIVRNGDLQVRIEPKVTKSFVVDENILASNKGCLPSSVVTERTCFNKVALKKLFLGGKLDPSNASACSFSTSEYIDVAVEAVPKEEV